MSGNWIDILVSQGDPFERRGIAEYGLGQNFPKYAEFWGKFILPSRDPSDSSKLRSDLDPNLEDVFNNHYGVFYHLVMAIDHLQNISNPHSDIAPPFYHLSSSIDLTERMFTATLRVTNGLSFDELPEKDFRSIVDNIWEDRKHYLKAFKDFGKSYHPININLLNVGSIFENEFRSTTEGKEFRRISSQIRHYRNVLIHSLHPLKQERDSGIYIPQEKYLHLYTHARWSSRRSEVNNTHYVLAEDEIRRLTKQLIVCLNNLWGILLDLWSKNEIQPEENKEDKFSRLVDALANLDGIAIGRASGVDFQSDEKPSHEWQDVSKPPTNPSGYKVENNGDPIL